MPRSRLRLSRSVWRHCPATVRAIALDYAMMFTPPSTYSVSPGRAIRRCHRGASEADVVNIDELADGRAFHRHVEQQVEILETRCGSVLSGPGSRAVPSGRSDRTDQATTGSARRGGFPRAP